MKTPTSNELVEFRMRWTEILPLSLLGSAFYTWPVAMSTRAFTSDNAASVLFVVALAGWVLIPVAGFTVLRPRLRVTRDWVIVRNFVSKHRLPALGTSFVWEEGRFYVKNGTTARVTWAIESTKFAAPLTTKQESVSAAIEQMGYKVTRPDIRPYESYNPPEVMVRDEGFQPNLLMVDPGDAVTWTWAEVSVHSITSDAQLFDSGVRASGSFSHRFTSSGTFHYRCSVPGCELAGEIVVREPAPPSHQVR